MLTVVCVLSSSVVAFAGEWKQDEVGWWWQDDNDSYPVSCWRWLDGNNDNIAECYYFNELGYIVTSTEVQGYLLNVDGTWIYNDVVQTQSLLATPIASEITGVNQTKDGVYELSEGEYLVGYDFDEGTYDVILIEGTGTWKYYYNVEDEDRVSVSKKFDSTKSGSANKRYNNLEMNEEGVFTVPKGMKIRLKTV